MDWETNVCPKPSYRLGWVWFFALKLSCTAILLIIFLCVPFYLCVFFFSFMSNMSLSTVNNVRFKLKICMRKSFCVWTLVLLTIASIQSPRVLRNAVSYYRVQSKHLKYFILILNGKKKHSAIKNNTKSKWLFNYYILHFDFVLFVSWLNAMFLIVFHQLIKEKLIDDQSKKSN